MGRLIDDLLTFSRLGRKELELLDIDMRSLAEEVFHELKKTVPDRNIKLILKQLPFTRGDLSMVRQLFVNLIDNATKFTGPVKNAVIEIGCEKKDGKKIYYVRDNGVGFDMKYADKLFQVFQRLHSSNQFEGTGVGLANVHRIVKRHGGEVWAEGAPGKGMAVYFTIP